MLKLAYNTTDSTIVVDEAGYSIGGREWGPYDTNDAVASSERLTGRLVDVDEDAARASGNPSVMVALDALDARRARTAAAKKMEKDELVEALSPEVLETLEVGGDGQPAKADLVEAVVADAEADVVVEAPPAPKPAKKTTSSRSAAQK